MKRSLIFATVVRFAVPLLLVYAVLLYLKGHNGPGGGFIAGLLTAAALVLRLLAYGREGSRLAPDTFARVVGVGLLVGLATATVPALLGYAFFTHTFGHVHVPLLGDVELASAALFDLGVYIVVVGNVVTVITAIAADE